MIKSKKLSSFKNIGHGFFNKLGGKSKGIYKSLNCDLGSSDNQNNVLHNLKIISKKFKTKKIILLNQIHSNKFFFINERLKFKNNRFKGDAIITDQKKIAVGVLTADCVPILIHDKSKNLICAIHAGWKGAYKDIIKNVIKFMKKNGSKAQNLIVAIGPCISVNNYEVQKDFKNKFLKKNKKNKIFFKKIKNKTYFNLSKYIHFELKKLNIKNIEIINKDTFDLKNNFFSARRSISRNESDYGRNISIIMIN